MRIVFASSSEIGLSALEALASCDGVSLVGVLTAPPARSGRGMRESDNPIAARAKELVPGAALVRPERLGAEARACVAALAPDLLATFSYGRIFGPKFLALFRSGALNVHPSLLPRWRGCSPIQSAILARDERTGVCVQRIAQAIDSGDLIERVDIPLLGRETASSLAATASAIGAEALLSAVGKIARGQDEWRAQGEAGATWSRAFTKEDGLVDWDSPLADLDAKIRAFDPWPGAYTELDGQQLSLLEAVPYPGGFREAPNGTVVAIDKARGVMVQTSDGLLAVVRLRLQARKPLHFRDFANGMRDLEGKRLG